MSVNKRSVSVRLSPVLIAQMRAWRTLGSLHNPTLVDYDESDILEYCVYRVSGDQDLRARVMMDPRDSDRLLFGLSDQEYTNTLSEHVRDLVDWHSPKTFRILVNTEELLNEIIKESPQKSKTEVVKSILVVVLTNSRELTRFLLRNSLSSGCLGTMPSYLNNKVLPADIKDFILYGVVPRNKNTPFENDLIKKFIDFVSKIGSREDLQRKMLQSARSPQIETLYSTALQEILKLKESDYAPYSKNDLLFPILSFLRIGEYLIHLNEILHIFVALEATPFKGIMEGSIFPRIVANFYLQIGTQDVSSNFDGVKSHLNKKFDDFRAILTHEAKSLLVLVT